MPDHVDDRYEWDEEKSDYTFARWGFDFQYACGLFDCDNFIEKEDQRSNYGEERSICTGRVEGTFITVVYTPRASRKRIISAWLSDKKEIDEYAKWFGI